MRAPVCLSCATTALALVLALSACGGGGGGGTAGDSSSTSTTSSPPSSGDIPLSLTLLATESLPPQSIDVQMPTGEAANKTVVVVENTQLATVAFVPNGASAGTFKIAPIIKTPGIYKTLVHLKVCSDAACGTVLDVHSYPLTLNVLPGLAPPVPSLAMSAYEAGSQVQQMAMTLPAGTQGQLSTIVDPSQPWLKAQVVDATTVKVTADATGIGPSTLQGYLTVRYTRDNGGVSDVPIPVAFTIGKDLVAPASQELTLDANTIVAGASGSVTVNRADGQTAAWTASSSAPWLTVTSSGSAGGTLSYAIDTSAVGSLPNLKDQVATVQIGAANVTPVSFTVTLHKRLPYLLPNAMPYGVAAGTAQRIAVAGGGFTQYKSASAALSSDTLAVSNVQVVSDNQMTMTVVAPAAGNHALKLAVPSTASSTTTVHAAAANAYAASSVSHLGEVGALLEDPVRQSVYATDNNGNAIYRFQYRAGGWTASALAVTSPVSLAMSPDGSHLMVETLNGLSDIDPDAWRLRASYAVDTGGGGVTPIAFSLDGKLWVPHRNAYASTPSYFDVSTGTMTSLAATTYGLQGFGYYASADGTKVLMSPDYQISPRPDWYVYLQASGTTMDLPGLDLFYDLRQSVDGSRIMMQTTGATYDASYKLMGQLPALGNGGEFYSRIALTPDGGRIVALVNNGFTPARFDIFSTSATDSGTTNFSKVASLPITDLAAKCASNTDSSCNFVGQLIVSLDGKTLFWVGNQGLQAIQLP